MINFIILGYSYLVNIIIAVPARKSPSILNALISSLRKIIPSILAIAKLIEKIGTTIDTGPLLNAV